MLLCMRRCVYRLQLEHPHESQIHTHLIEEDLFKLMWINKNIKFFFFIECDRKRAQNVQSEIDEQNYINIMDANAW